MDLLHDALAIFGIIVLCGVAVVVGVLIAMAQQ